jgi:hypothetical protein
MYIKVNGLEITKGDNRNGCWMKYIQGLKGKV